MKTILRSISLIALGIMISFTTMHILPLTINAVTAALSTTAITPLDEPFVLLYQQYPTSTKKKTGIVPFALPRVNLNNNGEPVQTDINGDGLTDLVLSNQNSTHASQYVLLNNGSGYETAYICISSHDYKTAITSYQGDCADYN
jgi:hypothetical protein